MPWHGVNAICISTCNHPCNVLGVSLYMKHDACMGCLQCVQARAKPLQPGLDKNLPGLSRTLNICKSTRMRPRLDGTVPCRLASVGTTVIVQGSVLCSALFDL